MPNQFIKTWTVKGHCATWTITKIGYRYYVAERGTEANKYFPTLQKAKWAIRTAEERYLQAHPNAPVANQDIWCDHGILWVDDWDGGYYND